MKQTRNSRTKAGENAIDALGHIDFPKRYYGEIYYEESVMNEIFQLVPMPIL